MQKKIPRESIQDSKLKLLPELKCPSCMEEVYYIIRKHFDSEGILFDQEIFLHCVDTSNCGWIQVLEVV